MFKEALLVSRIDYRSSKNNRGNARNSTLSPTVR